jgi:hypothetical protein
MGFVLTLYSVIAFLWITVQVEEKTKGSIKNMIIFVALFFISYSVSSAIENVETTVKDIDLNSMVLLDNDTINTTPKYIYVGRTNKYVFFFDIDKERADVIPQDKIKKISFSYQRPN